MLNFKYIKILLNKSDHKIIQTVSDDDSFLMEFKLKDNKTDVSFIKEFKTNDLTLRERIIVCWKILFGKGVKLNGRFKFKNGEHVVDISDVLHIYSRGTWE